MSAGREPASGTFWWLAKLRGQCFEEEGSERYLPADKRGDGVEAAAISALVGLALIGIGAAIFKGWYSWLLAVPVAFVLLHFSALAVALVAEILLRAHLLRARWRPAFQGTALVGLFLLLAVGLLANGRWQAVFAVPLLGFALLECIALPAKILWQRTQP